MLLAILGYTIDILLMLMVLSILYCFFIATFTAPFVPVSKKVARKMLAAADLRSGENHIELGSGDGRVLLLAARMGANSTGYELQWPLVLLTKIKAFFLRRKIHVHLKNFFKADLSAADVITMYLIPSTMGKVAKKLESSSLKSGTRIVSYAFKFPDWQEAKKVEREGLAGPIFIYKVGENKSQISNNK